MQTLIRITPDAVQTKVDVPHSKPKKSSLVEKLASLPTARESVGSSLGSLFGGVPDTGKEEREVVETMSKKDIIKRGVYGDLGIWRLVAAAIYSVSPLSVSVIDAPKTVINNIINGNIDIKKFRTSITHPSELPTSDKLYVFLIDDWGAEIPQEFHSLLWMEHSTIQYDLTTILDTVDGIRHVLENPIEESVTDYIAVVLSNYMQYAKRHITPLQAFMFSDVSMSDVANVTYTPTNNESRILGVPPNVTLVRGFSSNTKHQIGTCSIETIHGKFVIHKNGSIEVRTSYLPGKTVYDKLEYIDKILSDTTYGAFKLENIKDFPKDNFVIIGNSITVATISYQEIRRRVTALIKIGLLKDLRNLERSIKLNFTINGIENIGQVIIQSSKLPDDERGGLTNITFQLYVYNNSLMGEYSHLNPTTIANSVIKYLTITGATDESTGNMLSSSSSLLSDLIFADPVLFGPQSIDGVVRPYCRFCQQHKRRPRRVPTHSITTEDINNEHAYIFDNQSFSDIRMGLKCTNPEFPYLIWYAFKNGHCYPCCSKSKASTISLRAISQAYCLKHVGADNSDVQHVLDTFGSVIPVGSDIKYANDRLTPGAFVKLPNLLEMVIEDSESKCIVVPLFAKGMSFRRVYEHIFDTEIVQHYIVAQVHDTNTVAIEASRDAILALKTQEPVAIIVSAEGSTGVIVTCGEGYELPTKNIIRTTDKWPSEIAEGCVFLDPDIIKDSGEFRGRVNSAADFFNPNIMLNLLNIVDFYYKDNLIVAAKIKSSSTHIVVPVIHQYVADLNPPNLMPASTIKKSSYPAYPVFIKILETFGQYYSYDAISAISRALVEVPSISQSMIDKILNRDQNIMVTAIELINGLVIPIKPIKAKYIEQTIPIFLTLKSSGELENTELTPIGISELRTNMTDSLLTLRIWVGFNFGEFLATYDDVDTYYELVGPFIKYLKRSKLYKESTKIDIPVTKDGIVLTFQQLKSPVRDLENVTMQFVSELPLDVKQAKYILKLNYPVLSIDAFVDTLQFYG